MSPPLKLRKTSYSGWGLELGEEEDDGAFWMVVEAICTYWEEGSVNLLGKLTEEVRKKAQENDDEEDEGRNSVTVKAGNFLESS